MAHTAIYLEGALYEIMKNNLVTFGVNVIDSYEQEVIPQKILTVGPADKLTVRIRIDKIELYRINTLASITLVQIANFHIDVWGRTVDGINTQDNDGGNAARIWQLVNGLTEAANMGDVNWNNILAVKILYASPPLYTAVTGVQFRTLYGAATWN